MRKLYSMNFPKKKVKLEIEIRINKTLNEGKKGQFYHSKLKSRHGQLPGLKKIQMDRC
jgi:hypothetical protein